MEPDDKMRNAGQNSSSTTDQWKGLLVLLGISILLFVMQPFAVHIIVQSEVFQELLPTNQTTFFWKMKQNTRSRWMKRMCSSGIGTRKWNFEHLLVDEGHKVLYCIIPKAACTLWKNIMMTLNLGASEIYATKGVHNHNVLHNGGLTFLYEKPMRDRYSILKSYKKFIFVRNPLERVVSVYRDKFEYSGDKHFHLHAEKILQMRNATREHSNVTFAEFVNYILSGHKNSHWATFDDLCSPCMVNYDYIGKVDTMEEDGSNILHNLYNISKETAMKFVPLIHGNPRGTTRRNVTQEYLGQLSGTELTRLKQYYAIDFDLFHFRDTSL